MRYSVVLLLLSVRNLAAYLTFRCPVATWQVCEGFQFVGPATARDQAVGAVPEVPREDVETASNRSVGRLVPISSLTAAISALTGVAAAFAALAV